MMLLLANSATPVMFRTIALLLVGNLIIGIIEGAVVSRFFGFSRWRTTLLFIVANYCSTIAGVFLFGIAEARGPLPGGLFEATLHYAGSIVWICVAIAFAVSVIVEWPFCWLAARTARASARRTLLAALTANAVTYPLLFLLFADSTNTIGDDVQVVPLNEVLPETISATVYFIGDDGVVCSIDLNGANRTSLRDMSPLHPHDVLGWQAPTDDEPGAWELVFNSRDREDVLLENLPGRRAPFRSHIMHGDVVRNGWWLGTSGTADLRTPEARDWECTPRGNMGIRFGRKSTGEELRIALDTPFESWWGRCITILPGDLVVLELGQQVCVLSMPTQRIAFLARGQGPVVLMHEPGDYSK